MPRLLQTESGLELEWESEWEWEEELGLWLRRNWNGDGHCCCITNGTLLDSDGDLGLEQVIESGFELGQSKSQTRNHNRQ